MNIEEFRTYCLSFPGACDKMPFDKAASEYDRELLVFCVRDKWFCFVHIREFDFCCLKCDPDEAIDLRDRYEGIEPGYHMNKRHWINVRFDRDVPDSEIRRLVRRSYELVAGRSVRCRGSNRGASKPAEHPGSGKTPDNPAFRSQTERDEARSAVRRRRRSSRRTIARAEAIAALQVKHLSDGL